MSGAFHDHFSTVAGRYAAFRPHYPGALFDYLATLASRATLVWDCAAGSGQASGDLADRFDRVIATDASEEQITSAQPHPRIEYRVALAEESGLPDHSVGLVTVAQALHWLDLERFWPEVKRVLAPRGLLAVWGYGTLSVEGEAVNLLVQDFYEKTVGPYWPPERALVEGGFRDVSFPFSEITPPSFRMEARLTREQLLGYIGTWSATVRYTKANGSDPRAPLEAALKRPWGDASTPRLVTWPLAVRIGRANEL